MTVLVRDSTSAPWALVVRYKANRYPSPLFLPLKSRKLPG